MTDVDVDVDDIDQKLKKYNLDSSENLFKFKQTIEFDSISSDIICIEYTDKLFISISSTGKVGTVLFVRSEKVPGPAEEAIYSVKNLFGQFESILQVFARSLAEKFLTKLSLNKPILLSVGVERAHLDKVDLFKYYEEKILEFYSNNNIQ